MSIEKAFAIHATPNDIYAALQRDIASASAHEGETFEVLERERDKRIRLRVTIGMVPCFLTYSIEPKLEHVEVTAALEPYGWRYVAYQIATLGLRRGAFEMVLVQALVNLKAEVEGDVLSESGVDG
jgi:hypothetical protein